MAQIGYGVKLYYATGNSGTTWVELENLIDVTPPALKGSKTEIKAHNLPNDRVICVPNPLSKFEDCKVKMIYSATAYSDLLPWQNQSIYWKLEYTDNTADYWQGFMYELDKNSPLEKEREINMTIAVSGDISDTDPLGE